MFLLNFYYWHTVSELVVMYFKSDCSGSCSIKESSPNTECMHKSTLIYPYLVTNDIFCLMFLLLTTLYVTMYLCASVKWYYFKLKCYLTIIQIVSKLIKVSAQIFSFKLCKCIESLEPL